MKTKLKPWQITLLAIFSIMLAALASIFSLKATTVDEEETPEELVDNWDLDIVFYDSSVDSSMMNTDGSYNEKGKKTPLASINWDASDNSYLDGDPRIIIVQINYKNTNAVTTYNPNELEISIPNLTYHNYAFETSINDSHENKALWLSDIIVGANDSTHSGYDWNYVSGNTPNHGHQFLKFSNNKIIEEKSNFEGSIQIIYKITPSKEHYYSTSNCKVERFDDKCIHSFNSEFNATLSHNKTTDSNNESAEKTTINSNKLYFEYTRTYVHPWKYLNYTLIKKAEKITSYDLLGDNPEDYIWIKYFFDGYSHFEKDDDESYPNIPVTIESSKIYDILPTDCVCYSTTGERIMPVNENGLYVFENITSWSGFYVFIGYPKSIYNEENRNLQITNTADYYGTYINKTEQEKLSTASVSLNLADFYFNYDGNLYGVVKESNSSTMRYQDIINNWQYNSSQWKIRPTAYYTGQKTTVKIGDDLLYYLDASNKYTKLTDNDYYFSRIQFFDFHNGNGSRIENGKYDCELWVRYAGNTEYSLFEEFTIGNGGTTSNSDKDGNGIFEMPSDSKVVGFYFLIKDLEESIVSSLGGGYSATSIIPTIKFNKNNISESGTLYNFCYLQVFNKDENNNLILVNEPTIDHYNSLITKEEIATYDQEIYGTYMQRSYNSVKWTYYNAPQLTNKIFSYKTASSISQDAENEVFTGSFNISAGIIYEDSSYFNKNYIEQYNSNSLVTGFYIYDLLPEGMKLTSTKEEILNSTNILNGETKNTYYDLKNKTNFQWKGVYDKNGNEITPTELYNNIINSTTIEITENWNNTNRTHIKIYVDLSSNPLILSGWSRAYTGAYFSYNYEISYESYLEHGNIWKNSTYSQFDNPSSYKKPNDSDMFFDFKVVSDLGEDDIEAKDINNNNNLIEKLSQYTKTITITSIISTHQDVTTYVKTDQSNYSTGIVDTSNNSEYEYKLRVRTGSADITNLIIYTNIEEAQPNRTRWKGEFLGIDTLYAKNKGYIVKPYYSTNPKAENLYNEDKTINSDWKEYTEDYEELYGNGLKITFNEQSKTYNSSDYFYIYYYQNGKYYRSPQYYGTNITGLTVEIPSTDFYIYWYSNSTYNNAYGFSIDSIEPIIVNNPISASSYNLPSITPIELSGSQYPETEHNPYNNTTSSQTTMWHYIYTDSLLVKEADPILSTIKSLAFEYLDSEGKPAVLSANSLTYVLIKMKSPTDEDETRLARMDCWTQWNAIDEFNQPVDFITGINSNVVKVALPNSVKSDDMPSISLRFTKEITGDEEAFKNMNLNKVDNQIFKIRLTNLTANADGSYNQITALLNSNQELVITQIPIGTYLLEELGDNYFDFVEFTNNNDPEIIIEGVTFEKTDQGYIITVSEALIETIEFNIKVINEIEDERFFEDKDNKENLFSKNKIEADIEDPI